jgi:Domain of unknown function (DUF4157)
MGASVSVGLLSGGVAAEVPLCGDATAITLGDVVLCRNEQVAETDLKVWAHELTHVMQYQRWGIEGFADRYVRDSAAVEQEAIDNANRFVAWLPRRGLPPAGP